MNRSYAYWLLCVFDVFAAGAVCGCGRDASAPSPSPDAAGMDASGSDRGDAGYVDAAPPRDAADASDAGPLPEAGTISIVREGGTPISPFAFGQNYWDWVDWADSGMTGLTGTETLVAALHLDVLRAGGYNNDTNSPQPFARDQIDKYVTYCRAVGAEPILQVPVIGNDADGGPTTAQAAADMVTYANVTKGYGIRYWEIGNEPDLYSANFDSGVPLTAADYCTLYASYATAMKAASGVAEDGGVPLQFVGPDLSWKYIAGNDWLTPFLDGCKDYVDVVSIHRYPFGAAMLSPAGALNDSTAFRSALTAVRAIVQAHARAGAPLAVTEANVSYDFDPAKYTDASAQAEPGTFYAALWTTDALGVATENHLWTLAFWNIGEQSTAGSVLGFIAGGQPAPAYYAQQLLSSHFRGDVVVPTGVPTGFSAYASHEAAGAMSSILVLNKTRVASSITLAVDGLSRQSLDCPALSITLAQVPDAVTDTTHVWQYTPDLAAANLAPEQLQ